MFKNPSPHGSSPPEYGGLANSKTLHTDIKLITHETGEEVETGDVAVADENGYISIVDRVKDMILSLQEAHI